jgi:hypothetical protein
VKSGTRRRAVLAAAVLAFGALLPSAGCGRRSLAPETPSAPLGRSVTGVWSIKAAPFGLDVSTQVPVIVQLEDLGGGKVEVTTKWLEVPVHAVGRLQANVMSVRVDIPRTARGLVVAHFNGDNVQGNASGSYQVGTKWYKGQGVFSGVRGDQQIGQTDYPLLDNISARLWPIVGATYATPDAVRAASAAGVAAAGALILSMLAALAMVGSAGRGIRVEGPIMDTIVLRGVKAASHLVYYEYLSIDEARRCAARPKLLGFDPSKPATEDGVRGVAYETFEEDGKTFVSIPDLVLIVQLV